MIDAFDPQNPFAGIALPAQDLSKLQFCGGGRVNHVQKWAGQLQATRVAHTSAQLYRSLPEIGRLKTDAKARLEMLEILRPHVQNAIAGLAQDFLGQPLILPEPAQKAAIVAQALQKGMIDGYSLCVADWASQRNLGKQARGDLCTALYRALFSIGRLYLRSCQIYTQLPRGLWLLLHRLYRTADHFGLLAEPVKDELLKTLRSSTSRDIYTRTIVLACSRPNQLSQPELDLVFDALESWSRNVNLEDEVDPDNDNPFVINLSRDLPPSYKVLFDGNENDFLLEPEFSPLIRALQTPMSASALDVQTAVELPQQLTRHLTNAWEAPADRQQQRQKVKTVIDVCVGLTACHFHLAGDKTFAAFLQQREAVTQHQPLADILPRGMTPGERKPEVTDTSLYSPARVLVQNVSAGGYCLYWQHTVPVNVSAGQLLGIREAGQQEWLIGAVRWVRQLRGASQMGVQVLSLEAEPTAASLLYDTGGQSDPMRALQLPPDCHNRIPATLITAAVPFQEGRRVRLQNDARMLTIQLDKCLFSTSHVRQFSYQVLTSGDEPAATHTAPDGEFDSEWD